MNEREGEPEKVIPITHQFQNKVWVNYGYVDGQKRLECPEESCRFNFEKGCVNPEVLIDDSPGEGDWCKTYEPLDDKV